MTKPLPTSHIFTVVSDEPDSTGVEMVSSVGVLGVEMVSSVGAVPQRGFQDIGAKKAMG